MPNFRTLIPARRLITRTVNSHGDHKDDLMIDFNKRCGYCNAPDSWKVTYYEVDHFIPKTRNKVPFLTIKSVTDYTNLVYACRSCNNSKRNKWPTNDENIPNRNNEGFIDPCSIEYDKHFLRSNIGKILPQSPLGKWIYNALQLHKPQHEVIWNLEVLEKLIEEIEQQDLSAHPVLQAKLLETYKNYKRYVNDFRAL